MLGEELRTFLEQFVATGQLSKWSVPDRFYLVDAIPKTSVGKIDEKVIRKDFSQR